MTSPQNQNSILVLATLGVYLGLILAGATPQVLAQAEGDRFRRDNQLVCRNNGLIWNERQEDIDAFDYKLANRIVEFLEATRFRIDYLKTAEPSSIESEVFHFNQVEFAPYLTRKNLLMENDWKGRSSDWTSAAQAGQMAELQSLFLQPLSDCSKATHKKFALNSIDLRIDGVGLFLELGIRKASDERANTLAASFKDLFQNKSSGSRPPIKTIYYQTEVRVSANQVFIVTRLPRAGLDALLAKYAK